MIKKELIEMLANVPDEGNIVITTTSYDMLLGNRVSVINIEGYYKQGDNYILSGLNVRPYHDLN